jgi:hypothetical protein
VLRVRGTTAVEDPGERMRLRRHAAASARARWVERTETLP